MRFKNTCNRCIHFCLHERIIILIIPFISLLNYGQDIITLGNVLSDHRGQRIVASAFCHGAPVVRLSYLLSIKDVFTRGVSPIVRIDGAKVFLRQWRKLVRHGNHAAAINLPLIQFTARMHARRRHYITATSPYIYLALLIYRVRHYAINPIIEMSTTGSLDLPRCGRQVVTNPANCIVSISVYYNAVDTSHNTHVCIWPLCPPAFYLFLCWLSLLKFFPGNQRFFPSWL